MVEEWEGFPRAEEGVVQLVCDGQAGPSSAYSQSWHSLDGQRARPVLWPALPLSLAQGFWLIASVFLASGGGRQRRRQSLKAAVLWNRGFLCGGETGL